MKQLTNFLLVAFAIVFSFSLYSCDPTNPEVLEATSIELVSGGGQTGIITKHLENDITIAVKDQNGNGISNTVVKFEVEKGWVGQNGQSVSSKTDGNGEITLKWTLGPDEGTQTCTVTAFKADGTSPLINSPLTISATGTIPANVTDVDGNVYDVVKIGAKVWMAENLKVTKYADGTAIPNVIFNEEWAALGDNNTDKAYKIYNNVTHDICYYTLAAATNGAEPNTYTDTQGVCPDGWRLPTSQEWDQLINTLGGELVAGGKMKEAGTSHWWTGGNTATNVSGFTALPSGYRSDVTGIYEDPTESAYWWSYTSSLSQEAEIYAVFNNSDEVLFTQIKKSSGAGVRCVMDYDINY